ncbi:hypothetical protein [Deinococcus sp. KSM4-11]|uniref:hypothetical protein n=1 Tax=Deinococcus sp. KSM4-11 TaxID=2568654 RepID=UPI001F0D552F|nr:hypothetical protein [Deinococcus sp. KSM4-11]
MCKHPGMDAHRLSLTVTGALLLLLLALGLSLQLGYRRNAARWPHHALYFAVVAGTGLAALLTLTAGRRWWALLPALVLLLGMPRTRPGRSAHWRLALAAALAYALGSWGAW